MRQNVQYLPCGHDAELEEDEIIQLVGKSQLDSIAAGIKLDAVVLESKHCAECQEEANYRDRQYALYDMTA